MWPRSLLAIVGGCILSISLVLNLNYLLPFTVDNRILIGLLLSFPIWCVICLFCYACDNRRVHWFAFASVFIASSLVNGMFFVS